MHDDGVPFIQHDYEKTRARHDQEEKLIISAWYNMVSERVNTQKLKQELHPHHPIPHSVFLFPPPSLPVREWGCIRKCLVSGWAPPTRPCPSSPSRDNSPTQGEAWHDTTRDETRRRDSYPQMKSKVHTRWSMWSLSVFCLFLCLHWDHCASVLSRCCCPLLALTDMRRFLFSVGLQSRSSLLW